MEYKNFVLCRITDDNECEFVKNIETSERGYFEIDNLPELSEIRNTEKQIRNVFWSI